MEKKSQILSFISSFILLLVLLSCSAEKQNNFKAEWPKISNETKPWTRWWWHGSAVNKTDLTTNLEELKNSGFGGVEVTPIYGVKGYEDQDLSFLSSEWMEEFSYTLQEGKRLDLGIDLANASGWPFGGPWVTSDDACKNVQYKVYTLKEGEILNEKVEFVQEPLVRAVGHNVDISEIKFPISSNNNLQELALDQVRFKKKIPLQALIAYGDNGEAIDILDHVDKDGMLNWTAPKGKWKLYAIFQGWHGKMVERAGKGGEGNVIDHFSGEATKNFLNVFEKNSKGFNITGIRAFFNDSYEVDDAQGEGDWTPKMFEEFEKLRGYNLKDHLPALFGKDVEEINKKVLSDYRETISDLLLQKFTKTWGDWAKNYNAEIRNQAHGSPANILDLYAASDIPETEGTSSMRIKLASSAGHVSGKPLIACEAATWLDEHFLSDLSAVKMNLDRYLVNGVNHIVYHGTPYSPKNEQWPGWMFYASVHFAPTNTWWEDLKTINSYVTNCQSFMQNSKPANDILLYYPIYDSWSEQSKSMLQHFGTANDKLTKELSEFLLTNGYMFDYISDKQIQQLSFEDNKILSNKVEYKTIVIPKCNYIPFKTIEKIISLAEQGATIIVEDNFPSEVPGLSDFKNRQQKFEELKKNIEFVNEQNIDVAKVKKGKILKGNNISILLLKSNVLSEPMAASGLWLNRVNREEGIAYLIINWSEKDIDGWVSVNSSGEDAVWFNPMNKAIGKARTKNINKESAEVYLQLGKGETLILQWYPNEQNLKDYPIYEKTKNELALEGEWEIDFVKGGPTLPASYCVNKLTSWTNHSDELKRFSGTARYKTSFDRPSNKAPVYQLNLGEVFVSAVVYLNGEKLSTLVGPTFKLNIESDILKDKNVLEVFISNLMANRIIGMEKRGEIYKKFYNINFAAKTRETLGEDGTFTAINWEPLKSGLLGPVTLTPVEIKK